MGVRYKLFWTEKKNGTQLGFFKKNNARFCFQVDFFCARCVLVFYIKSDVHLSDVILKNKKTHNLNQIANQVR